MTDKPFDTLPELVLSDMRGDVYARRAQLIDELDKTYYPVTPVDRHKLEHLADLILRAEQYRYAIETWQEQKVRDAFQKIHAAKSKLSPSVRKEAWKHGWRPPESLELGDWVTPQHVAEVVRVLDQLEDPKTPLRRIDYAREYVRTKRCKAIAELQKRDPDANEVDYLLQMSPGLQGQLRAICIRDAYAEKERLERRIETQRRLRAKLVMEALPPETLLSAQKANEKEIAAIVQLFKIRPEEERTRAYRMAIRQEQDKQDELDKANPPYFRLTASPHDPEAQAGNDA